MLAEELAMVSLLMESVVISFALGGVVGAVVAVHLLYRKNETTAFSMQEDNPLDSPGLFRQKVDTSLKIPPHR